MVLCGDGINPEYPVKHVDFNMHTMIVIYAPRDSPCHE